MRAVIIGDSHLQGTNPRNGDRLRAWDQIIDAGVQLPDLGAWLHVGDVFHARSTPDDRVAVAERLVRMANSAPVVVIYGNHDSPLDLHVFGKLKAAHPIIVVDQPQTVMLRQPLSDVPLLVACLPYPTKAGLVSDGVAPGEVQDTATTALDAVFMKFGHDLAEARHHGAPVIFLAHATINGSVTSVGQPMGVHGEIVVTATHLNRLGDIPKVFGHIHKAQDLYGATYAGSICRMDYGETEEKRFLVADFTRGGWTLESHPIDCPPRYHVDGVLTRDGFDWQVTKGPGGVSEAKPATWRGAEVRVRYTFAQSQRSALDQARVLAEFADALRLEIEPIAVPDRPVRAPQVATARTLEGKLAAYLNVEEVPVALVEKLRSLETTEAISILTQVQNALTAIEAGENVLVAA
jgi:DNA repair exonuclease SbcCD nuclease subunit